MAAHGDTRSGRSHTAVWKVRYCPRLDDLGCCFPPDLFLSLTGQVLGTDGPLELAHMQNTCRKHEAFWRQCESRAIRNSRPPRLAAGAYAEVYERKRGGSTLGSLTRYSRGHAVFESEPLEGKARIGCWGWSSSEDDRDIWFESDRRFGFRRVGDDLKAAFGDQALYVKQDVEAWDP